MFSLVQAMWDPSQPLYSQWVLHEDPTVGSPPGWWGVELISPLLRDFPGSEWRHDVQAVWDFIAQHYFVGGQKVGDMTCSTHVHISRAEGYSVSDLKKIAQAIIYFEPAFEPILPPDRRGNEYARSNWIDNPSFGYKNLSRDQSIDYLETLTTIDQVIDTMCPNQSKYFGWNFVSVKKFSTIEFRRGPYSATVDDVYMWVDVAESFIKSALAIQSKSQLQQNPVTVGGLETFLTRAPSTGPRYLSRLFAGKTLTARGDPIPVGKLTPSKQALLQKKINADIASQPTLDMIAAAQTDHTFY
ncbi:hypothetical protein FQN50_004282 [Emmonsiellopsis sp. PD_5]|nr:hypothetical protein FQN50_004282 [Emmonsiellopsis sp. PD_5]